MHQQITNRIYLTLTIIYEIANIVNSHFMEEKTGIKRLICLSKHIHLPTHRVRIWTQVVLLHSLHPYPMQVFHTSVNFPTVSLQTSKFLHFCTAFAKTIESTEENDQSHSTNRNSIYLKSWSNCAAKSYRYVRIYAGHLILASHEIIVKYSHF